MADIKNFAPDNLQSKDLSIMITVGELAKELGIATGTVYNRMRFGDLPFILTNHYFGQGRKTRKGERILFDRKAVSCWRAAYAKKWKS